MRKWLHRVGCLGAVLAVALLSACETNEQPGGATSTTVEGVVLDARRDPLPNATVLIDGSATLRTDAQGEFTATDVPIPYDAVIIPNGSLEVAVYRGLTRSDPVLLGVPFGAVITPPTPYRATITGTLSGGGGFPQPVGTEVALEVTVDSSDPDLVVSSSTTLVDSSTGDYTVEVNYGGTPNVSVTIHALHAERNGGGAFVDFLGYAASSSIAASDGSTVAGQDFAMGSVTTGSVSGQITVPVGFTASAPTADLMLDDGTQFDLSGSATPPSFDFVTPMIPGATVTVSASASDADGRSTSLRDAGLPTNASGLALGLETPPMLQTPPDGATGIDISTEFSWSEFGDGVHIVAFVPDAPTDPTFYVLTGDGNTTIPDLSSQGLGLPSSAVYGWSVIGALPVDSVDAVAAPGTSPIFFNPATDLLQGFALNRSFTTN